MNRSRHRAELVDLGSVHQRLMAAMRSPCGIGRKTRFIAAKGKANCTVRRPDGNLSHARATWWTAYQTPAGEEDAVPTIKRGTRLVAAAGVIGGTLLVGWVDYASGAEVRVLALYFLPLLLAGWSLGTTGAFLAALASTAVWLTAMHTSGVRFSQPYVWVVNGFTEGLGFLMVALLVARLRKAVKRESLLSRTDPVTGGGNRRAFLDLAGLSLALSKRNGGPASLAYIDLDNFKQVNDAFGHDCGDQLLRQCSTIISQQIRSSDTVARLGGDEFAIFLPETDANSAAILMERIGSAIDTAGDFRSTAVTTSIGVVTEAPAESSLLELLRKADAQMYAVKARKKTASRA